MNKGGKRLLEEAREIIKECSKLETPERAAHVAVFILLTHLDGSGEGNLNFRIIDDKGKLVEFQHHQLG